MDTGHNAGERAGRWVGRAWWAIARQEVRAQRWLGEGGLPQPVAAALVWIVNLTLLAMLLYAVFWLALLILFAGVAAWLARHANVRVDEKTAEWRDGLMGFGLYSRDGYRIDPHSFEDN